MNGVRATLAAWAAAAILIAIPYAVPGLERLRLLTPLAPGEGITLAPAPEETVVVGETELPPAVGEENAELVVPEHVEIPERAREVVSTEKEESPPVSIVGPDSALAGFFRQLEGVERGKGVARVAVWGDSNVASDLVTSVLRRALQERFGDAGHGFVLLTRTSKNYFHNDVRQIAAAGWGVSQMTTPLAPDGLYGLGAVTFRSLGARAFAKLGTAATGKFGRRCSKLGIPYLEQPDGGGFEVLIDGELHGTVSTDGEQKRAKVATFDFADDEHVIEIRSTSRDARIFGAWLEREGPGVVLDALGVTNSKIRYLLRTDEDFMARQIELRDPQLLVVNFGVNGAREGRTLWGGRERYEEDVRTVLARFRKHHPDRSCLVVSPGDAAARMGSTVVSFPLVKEIVELQEKAAVASGCAFWSMYAAMGGQGSMGRWEQAGLGKEDLLHPANAGAKLLGNWLYLALMERYAAYAEN